jgi:cytochrome c-550 PedF
MQVSFFTIPRTIFAVALIVAAGGELLAHGDVQPQPVDTTGLDSLGKEWRVRNPYREGDGKVLVLAIEIGSGAYNQNCARCHGLEGKSGGLAPDLRLLEEDADGDEWYVQRVRNGFHQNGVTKMPAYQDLLSQEALWCIRSYIDSLSEED